MFDEKDLVSAKEARELSETSLSSEALYELEVANEFIQVFRMRLIKASIIVGVINIYTTKQLEN